MDRFFWESQNFTRYLQQKQKRLVDNLFAMGEALFGTDSLPSRPLLHRWKKNDSLSDIVETYESWMEEAGKNSLSKKISSESLGKQLSDLIWEWVDWLDVGVGNWIERVKGVLVELWVHGCWGEVEKEVFVLQKILEDLLQFLQKMEALLNAYANVFGEKKKKHFFQVLPWLDSYLEKRVQELRQFLQGQMGIFTEGWAHYQKEKEKWSLPVQSKTVLEVSEEQYRDYENFFTLLALQENPGLHPKMLEEPICRTLRKYVKPAKNFFVSAVERFRLHLCTLSHEWKRENMANTDLFAWQSKVACLVEEMTRLSQCMGRFRTFLLTHDPNPYLRARWGFTEWVAGPESAIAKQMVVSIEQVEELRATGERFLCSLRQDRVEKLQVEESAWHTIQHILHQMGSPVISLADTQILAERFVEQFSLWDEFGAFASVRVMETGRFLSAALREDWKFFSLSQLARFRELYQWHRLLWPIQEEPAFTSFWKAWEGVIQTVLAHRNRWEETCDMVLENFFVLWKERWMR